MEDENLLDKNVQVEMEKKKRKEEKCKIKEITLSCGSLKKKGGRERNV